MPSTRFQLPNYSITRFLNSFLPSDDVAGTHSLADPAPRAYTPAWWQCRHDPGWFAPYAGRRRSPPCGWRNCDAACAGWRGVRPRPKPRSPSARPAAWLTGALPGPGTAAATSACPPALPGLLAGNRAARAGRFVPKAQCALCRPCRAPARSPDPASDRRALLQSIRKLSAPRRRTPPAWRDHAKRLPRPPSRHAPALGFAAADPILREPATWAGLSTAVAIRCSVWDRFPLGGRAAGSGRTGAARRACAPPSARPFHWPAVLPEIPAHRASAPPATPFYAAPGIPRIAPDPAHRPRYSAAPVPFPPSGSRGKRPAAGDHSMETPFEYARYRTLRELQP